jgi:hypothetical protein
MLHAALPGLIASTEHSPWALGWETCVAAGTLVLAVSTWTLAGQTRRSVEAARDEQSAQWRPMVLPDVARSWVRDPDDVDALPQMNVVLDNHEGRGPAFSVSAKLATSGGKRVMSQISGGVSERGIMRVGATAGVDFPLDKGDSVRFGMLTLMYTDLAGRPLWTTVDLSWSVGTQEQGYTRYALWPMTTRLGTGQPPPWTDADA